MIRGLKKLLQRARRSLASRRKVFCVGLNKTGTTSITEAFRNLGLRVGDEVAAKKLLKPWAVRDFPPIIKYCRSADAFQDSPFSFPYTYQALDQAFPRSKFILSVRSGPGEWYQSLVEAHGRRWANGAVPTKADLQEAVNVYRGRPWEANRLLFETPEGDPYNKEVLTEFYVRHQQNVKDYFRHREGSLLVLNVASAQAYGDFCVFLGEERVDMPFPWRNRTDS